MRMGPDVLEAGSAEAGDVRSQLELWRAGIEQSLVEALAFEGTIARTFHDGLRHAVLGGGKRYRGLLVMALGADFTVPEAQLLSSAAAIELIHAASLVIDDLPCMDNASRRRAAPSTHAAFGEATAILCGVALLARANDLVVGDATLLPEVKARIGEALSVAVGATGLCGGQFDDLFPARALTEADLVDRYRRKTGALFAAALQCPGHVKGASTHELARLGVIGERLGLAFQLYDDLIDLVSTAEIAGKDVGQDGAKITLATHLGAAAARARAEAELDAVRVELTALCGRGRASALVEDMAARAAGFLR